MTNITTVIVQRQSNAVGSKCLLAGLLVCLAAGGMVAGGQATIALMVVGVALLGLIIVLEQQRAATVLWSAVAFSAPLQGIRVAPILAVSDVLLFAAFLSILPNAFRGWRRSVPAGVVPAFGVLIVAGLVGTFFASDVRASLENFMKIVLAAAGSVVAMAVWDPARTRLREFAWLWFGGAVASAGWATITPRSFAGRSLGLTTHPNHFGLVCVLAIGLGLGLVLSSRGRARTAAVTGTILLTVGVGLSGSRAAVLGLAVTVTLTAFLTRRFRLLVLTGALLVLAAMAVIIGILHVPDSHALSRIGGGGGSELSDAERRQALDGAFASIAQHPLTGEGFESAQAALNIYLQALVVGGPLALLGFLGVCGLIIRAGLKAVSLARGDKDCLVLAGLTAGYAGYLSSGAFDNILWDRYLWTYIGFLLLLAASTHQQLPVRTGPRRALRVRLGTPRRWHNRSGRRLLASRDA